MSDHGLCMDMCVNGCRVTDSVGAAPLLLMPLHCQYAGLEHRARQRVSGFV